MTPWGTEQRAERSVVLHRIVLERRIHLYRVSSGGTDIGAGNDRAIKHSESAADCSFAVPERIIGEPESRSQSRAEIVHKPLRHSLCALDQHSVRQIAGIRNNQTDLDRRQVLAGERIVSRAHSLRIQSRLVQQRRLTGIETGGVERRRFQIRCPQRNVSAEAQAIVQGSFLVTRQLSWR